MSRLGLILLLGIATACGPRAVARPTAPPPLAPDAYAHYLRGRLAVLEGAYDRAVVELRQAAAAAPDEAMIALALIDATYRTGRKTEARDAVLAAQARWPRQPQVWLLAGKVFRGLGNHDRARLSFERAIRLDRGNEKAWLGLASAWIALQRPDAAERAYRSLLVELPDSIDGRFLLARTLIERGQVAAAEPELRKVLELDPDHIDARLALARALRGRGELADAVLQTRQAFDRTGGDLGVAEELFWLLCEADDRQGALDLLGLLDDSGADLGQRLGVAHLYRAIGALDDAIAVADAARAAWPDSAAAAIIAAQARADRGDGTDRADALALLAAVPDDDDLAAAARALTIDVLLAQGERVRAREVAEAALAAHPGDVDLIAAHAEVQRSDGKIAAGRKELVRAVRRDQGSVGLRYAWASYEDRAGAPTRAAAVAEQILAAHPDHVGALNLAGYALTRAGADLDKAARYLARARDLAPGDPSILDSWGWLLYRQGKVADAAAALARAARFAPHQAEIQQHLREVQTRLRGGNARAAGQK